jgi:hypothetical protein
MPHKKPVPPVPAVPANEVVFLNEAVTNFAFRMALQDAKKDRKKISDELDRLNIRFNSDKEKEEALDAIEKIDWNQLHHLEDLLGRGLLDIKMG